MKFYNIFFSPTGGTKKVADIIINGTKQEAEVIDLIKEPDKIKKVQFKKDDVCLVGVPFKPTVNKKCTSCGLCAKECPTGAISLDDPKITDNDKCISCMHCVAVCPKKARNYSKFISFIAGRNMKKICSGRKENKLYL